MRSLHTLLSAGLLLGVTGCPEPADDDDPPLRVRLDGEHRLDEVGELLPGDTALGVAGSSLAAVGDLDGDGFDDLAMGAPGLGDGAGGVLLWFGGADGPTLDGTLLGVDPGDAAGSSVAGLGDIDGDGNNDLVVGAPGAGEVDDADDDLATGLAQGAAYIVTGIWRGDRPLSQSRAVLLGGSIECAGYSVAGAGDFDADGHPDLVVGAPCRGSYKEFHEHVQAFMLFDGPGAAYLVSSSLLGEVSLPEAALARFDGLEIWDRFGRAVAGIGDHDGDLAPDVAVGAPDYFGAIWINPEAQSQVYVLPGAARGIVDAGDAIAALQGGCCGTLEIHDELGNSLAVTDSGFAAGAPGLDDFGVQGGAFVVTAPLSGTLDPWEVGDVVVGPPQANLVARTGSSLAAGFDLDCDGIDDLAVGAPEEMDLGSRGGGVRVAYGPLTAYNDLATTGFHGQGASSEAAGYAVVGADLDGDGCDELIVGAPANRTGGTDAGGAWRVSTPFDR